METAIRRVCITALLHIRTTLSHTDPIHSIATHPNVEFVVIVNPNSGPYAEYPNSALGRLSLPGHDYCREIPKLNIFKNVTVIGYVRIDYCKKPLSEVFAEIETYAAWSREPGLAVEGIFVDETPNHYSAEKVAFLEAIKHGIRSGLTGLAGTSLVSLSSLFLDQATKSKQIMHNPGTPPDAPLAHTADVIVTCEEPFQRYQCGDVRAHYTRFNYAQAISACQISATPRDEIVALTQNLRRIYAYIFVTDLIDNFYESFGSGLKKFVYALE